MARDAAGGGIAVSDEPSQDRRDAPRDHSSIDNASPRQFRSALIGGAGTAIAIGVMEAAATRFSTPLALIPFVTSIVLVLCLPDAEPARPRALVGGHVVASLAGYLVLATLGDTPVAVALSVGLAAAAMHLTRTMHPPAGIDPLLIVHQQLGFDFLAFIVVPGALALALFAALWRRLSRNSAP
jgi:CBS-domain-containing membrane protein